MMTGATSWRRFWDGEHRIYANERHRIVHYRRIAQEIIGALPHRDAVVLDFGCGEALDAARVAESCARLTLCEDAPTIRARLVNRFHGSDRIAVIAPAEIPRLEPGSIDLAVVNSVIQYMSREELDLLLRRLQPLIRRGGRLLLGDVIPPGVPMIADVASLLRTAHQGGFVPAAIGSLVATFFSDYRRLRRDVGLAIYDEDAMLAILAAAGFVARRREKNIGFHARRMTFVATPSL